MRVGILVVLFTAVYIFSHLPVFAFGFIDWSLLAIIWGVALLFYALQRGLKNMARLLEANRWLLALLRLLGFRVNGEGPVIDISYYKKPLALGKMKGFAIAGIILIGIGVVNLFILPFLTSNPLLFNQAYRNLLGPVTESSFTADVAPIALSQIRIVDSESARKLAEKKIGEVPALGSEVQLGELVLQKIQDKLYYAAPLEHRGFFQWLSNHQLGSKGYVLVSATNPQDVRLIQNVDGDEVHIKVQPQGFLWDYLPRYLYFHGFYNVGMTDFSFEIDDNYHPYWVVTLYKNKVGFSGPDAVGVAVVDAESGEISSYSLENAPQWIDRVQPGNLIYKQIADWGEYINGFWNALFTKAGTLKPAGDTVHLIYGEDGSVYWYTGITSSGKDQSTVGFVLVNSRTKEAKWYKVAGATEEGAKKSAEGQVQEKGYRSANPILYNIYGVPTYIASLKDKEGLLKAVSFVSVENYNLVGVGPDVETGLRNYRQMLASQGNQFIPGSENHDIWLNGKVLRVNSVVKGGESYTYFMIEGDPRVFAGTAQISPRLPLLQAGDTVKVGFLDNQESMIMIREFTPSF
ncbi:MAG: hypothetical protein E6713_11030 [Sporomusaceae bacterium]|nr:hypothetical protein [Sporomusaceae bacterium]